MAIKTIHLVFNAHIDPVWLWPWSSGLDEILNTCESMCNLLDRNPDAIFTRGEAWVYEQVERIDPALFRRIAAHIKAGRWEVVGGWYVQPDCNLPGYAGLEKQIELGREYFTSRFGIFPETAFNVDTFGHTAYLPRLMAAAGQKSYVMMRPQEHELTLPARLFRWRTAPGGREITTFRIAGAYNSLIQRDNVRLEQLRKSLTELPPGIDHTMCFAGVGDHGGGPTEEMIEWCRANERILPGARLVFSSPARFFRAVASQRTKLPVVTGELQQHAVGCYSVHRGIKLGVRRAERQLVQAGMALKSDPELAKAETVNFDKAWRWVCFNHFHDTLGGTCLPSSYAQAEAQIGFAQTVGDEILQLAIRRKCPKPASDARQRLVIANFSAVDFDGWVEHDPWLDANVWLPDCRLLDEKGKEIPYQRIQHESVTSWPLARLLFKLRVPRGGVRVVRLGAGKGVVPKTQDQAAFALQPRGPGWTIVGKRLRWEIPALELVQDASDAWSHGVSSYDGKIVATAKWGRSELMESGPLLCAWRIKGTIGKSRIEAEWRRYAGEAFIELRLRVVWLEMHRILRLAWSPGDVITRRVDGVSGGPLRRECDGRELPVRDWSLLQLKGGDRAGVVFPDTYSLSGTPRDLRLTLLRSSILAHHDPSPKLANRRLVFSDQGEQAFLFRFYPPGRITAAGLEKDATALQEKPLVSDVTRGMPCIPERRA